MSFENTKLFILTYQKGSFASAARVLDVAPSSVSRAVGVLENQLNTRLFHRNTRSLKPTQEGDEYYQRMVPLVDEFDSINQRFIGNKEPYGSLRVSVSASFGQLMLAPVLRAFCTQYPNINIELLLSDQRIDLVEEQVDIAIRHGTLADSALVARKLRDVRYSLVASPEYISKTEAICYPKDLLSHQIVAFNYKAFSKEWFFSNGEMAENLVVEPFLRVSNAAFIRDCILNGMGLALLADWTIEKDIDSGAMVSLLPEWSISGADKHSAIWVIRPARTYVPERVSVFTNFLFEHLGK